MGDLENNTETKVLVLGSRVLSPQVDSYLWNGIPTNLNVADFDAVLLNFHPLKDPDFASSIDIETIPPFQQFARLLFSPASQIIAIGSPFFRIGNNPYIFSTWWLPVSPHFLEETGDTVELKAPDYSTYFGHVRRWDFCFTGWDDINPAYFQGYMREAGLPRAAMVRPRLYPIADNRYGRAIAFGVLFEAMSEGGGDLGQSGIVRWLPPPTEITADEAIELVLRERFGIAREETAPEWLGDFTLPSELPIVNRIDGLEEQIGSLAADLDQARNDLKDASRFKRMLYETGEDVLEPIVRDGLAQLGATVELPKARGKEDGRITDPGGRLGTIEIKGRGGQLRLGDVRQTHQWVADRIAFEETESKGILIANLNKDASPFSRGEVFPRNCVAAAENFEICLFTTTQLFNALGLSQKGELDESGFWDAIFLTAGISPFPELSPS